MAYDPEKAVRYADRWWNKRNPAYPAFTDDCTNFISQCLHEGGLPMTRGWWCRRRGKRFTWSFSWAVAHSFYLLLNGGGPTGNVRKAASAFDLRPGDVICYDFEGDGRWNHNVIVTAIDADGAPLVNAHTNDSFRRRWEYRDSAAWTPNTRYAFFRIA
ncbi:amidase domain-containing protein [Staphylospora marina]|uniref:amidase domain-containing protein n=1 Tax=Staphylospora marina TaxID=2490858 RepID=UPI000F5BF031